jgi:hypothetical protein
MTISSSSKAVITMFLEHTREADNGAGAMLTYKLHQYLMKSLAKGRVCTIRILKALKEYVPTLTQ